MAGWPQWERSSARQAPPLSPVQSAVRPARPSRPPSERDAPPQAQSEINTEEDIYASTIVSRGQGAHRPPQFRASLHPDVGRLTAQRALLGWARGASAPRLHGGGVAEVAQHAPRSPDSAVHRGFSLSVRGGAAPRPRGGTPSRPLSQH